MAAYLAVVAALDTLRRAVAPRGITRFVIVQPSFYGTDNALLMESLDALGGDGRGVAVIDPAATPRAVLADYTARGARPADQPLQPAWGPVSARARRRLHGYGAGRLDMGWHVQVVAPLDVLIGSADVLVGAPVPVVIDHYGLYGRFRPQSAVGQRLIELLRLPHVWVKLSAPYRLADGPLSTKPDREWLDAIVRAAPERCVWGSDWPHPPAHDTHTGRAATVPYRDLSYETLVDDFIAALPFGLWPDAIMRDNPARLYGFSSRLSLEHDPEKWTPVFGKDHASAISWSGMTIRRKVILL